MKIWMAGVLITAVCAAVSDLFRRTVPRKAVLLGVILRTGALLFSPDGLSALGGSVFSGVLVTTSVLFTVLLFERVFARKCMGGGDLWFLFLLTYSCSFEVSLYGLISGLVFGALYASSYRFVFRKGKEIPLTPFLLAGYECVLLWAV